MNGSVPRPDPSSPGGECGGRGRGKRRGGVLDGLNHDLGAHVRVIHPSMPSSMYARNNPGSDANGGAAFSGINTISFWPMDSPFLSPLPLDVPPPRAPHRARSHAGPPRVMRRA